MASHVAVSLGDATVPPVLTPEDAAMPSHMEVSSGDAEEPLGTTGDVAGTVQVPVASKSAGSGCGSSAACASSHSPGPATLRMACTPGSARRWAAPDARLAPEVRPAPDDRLAPNPRPAPDA